MTPALIGVDWGTSSLRAYLLSADGDVLAATESPSGIMALAGRSFEAALQAACAPWSAAHGALPAVLSGMIGSRQGWIEAPYVTCPAALPDLVTALVALSVDGLGPVRLVPGLSRRDAAGVPDVMRGEECQVLGAMAATGLRDGRFLLPGTHSKLVEVRDGRILGFRTFMTGEVFAALRGHTILGRMMAGTGGDGEAFRRGVAAAERARSPGDLLALLFSARTLRLFDEIGKHDAFDYLSGMLIGAELATLRGTHEPVVLVGGAELAQRYDDAATALGIAATMAPADCVRIGHLAIARAAKLIGREGRT
ncbi:MAG: 2-dehydro-3-deoxygalactonokinase [Alphaproteobacteria bacterium]